MFLTDREDAFLWKEIEDGIQVYGYLGVKNQVAIPESIQGKPVVEIGRSSLWRHEPECDILISASVQRFSPDVFTGNRYYGNRKSWFEDFRLAENHPWIRMEKGILYDQGGKRLVHCFDKKIRELVIPQGVTAIGKGAFYKCAQLKSVTLPEGLEIIEDQAFLDCFGLLKLQLPDTVKTIGYNAFGYSSNSLNRLDVNVPAALEQVSSNNRAAWNGFENHPNFMVQDQMLLSKDGKRLFALLATEEVTDVLIPEGVEEILPHAFARSGKLKKLTLSATMRIIRENAFGEHRVKTLRIPAALETIEDGGFDYSGLGSVIVDKQNTHFYTDKTCLFRKLEDGKLELLCCFRNKLEEYQVPEGTVSVCAHAFVPCTQLKELTLPESLEVFDETAVERYCNKAKLPAGLKKLYRDRNKDFSANYKDLNSPTLFWDSGVLYQQMEDGLVAIYSNQKVTSLALREGTVRVAEGAFKGEYGKVIFPASVQYIEKYAFQNTQVKEVEFSEGLCSIGQDAFENCAIETLHIPASVRYIHPNAFDHCPLKSYQVAEGSAYYCDRDGVLYSADGKELVDVPAQLQCEEFIVPEGVEDIATAFLGCEYLKTIRIPASVKNLWRMAVVGCRRLHHLYVDAAPDFVSLSFIDFDFPITIHANPGSSVIDMVEDLMNRGYEKTKLKIVINGMEDLDKLSRDFRLVPNPTGLTISRCLNMQADIVVPASFGEHPVTVIGKRAFAENWGQEVIESVALPNTITCIDDGAFDTCRKMHTVKLQPGIKILGKKAFHNCAALTELILPDGVEEIGAAAFFGCEALKLMSLPASVRKISPWIFADISYDDSDSIMHKDLYLDEKTLFRADPGSYAESFLREYRINKWGDIKSLTVVHDLPGRGETTAEEKEALKFMDYTVQSDGTVSVSFKSYPKEDVVDAVVPATIMGMPVTRLDGLTSLPRELATLTLPASIREISGLYRLSFYREGKQMRRLQIAEDNAHYWSDGHALYSKDRSVLIHMMNFQLDSYTVHPDTRIIEAGAFGCFGNLKTLILPDGLQEIRAQAFESCPLENIEGVEKVPNIADGVLRVTPWYNKQTVLFNGTELTKYSDTNHVSYTVPDGTTRIAANAFYLRAAEDKLEELILPDSVTELGSKAFAGRKKLKSIRFGNGIKALNGSLMSDCTAIETLHIPASVEEISADALPETQIGWRTVERAALRQITVDENNPNFMAKDGILYSKDGGVLLKVPAAYPATAIVVPDHVHTIGEGAFRNVQNLQTVQLSASVKVLEKNAFYKCELLSKIDLSAVETFGASAFYECKALTEVTLCAKHVGETAFTGCSALTALTLNATQTIGKYAFRNCTGLKSLVLPETLETIGEGAFENCRFSQIVIPKSVKSVGNESFSGCPDITVYDSIDPDAKEASAHTDNVNGSPNSLVGFVGIGPAHAMWQCAANHTWIDHEITVRSAETDEIKYKVSMYADPKQRMYYCLLTSSWGRNATFNFAALDEFFPDIKGVPNKMRVALNRLLYPVNLSEGVREAYTAYLVRVAKDLVKDLIDKDDMQTFLFCAPFGILKKNNIDELIEYATKAKAVQFAAWLMEYKNDNFAGKKTAAKLPALSLKIEEPWQAPKSGSSKIGRYKGTDMEVVYPTEWKGKPLTGVAGTTTKVPENYKNITSVVLPEGYTSIGDYAFYGCSNLERITLPTTLETIGKDAFAGCVKLQEIIMPDSVTFIGEQSFQMCKALSRLKLSENLTNIPERAFFGCDALQEVELPRKVRSVNKDSFYGGGLKRMVVHSSGLYGSGQCFWGAVQVYAYESAEIRVYGVQKRYRHNMTIAEQTADLLLTLKITGSDGSQTVCNFFREQCADTMQKTGSKRMTQLVAAARNGTELGDALNGIYGGKLLQSANNRAEAKRLEEADISGAVCITVTEEKKHPDGQEITIFTYTAAEKQGTMKTRETLTGTEKKTSGYYHSYYSDYYGDHVDNQKPKKAEAAAEEPDDFVDITDSDGTDTYQVFKTDSVDALEFRDKIFVLTGFGAAEEEKITGLITGKGGEVKSSVVLKTDYLVVNDDYENATSKYKKALELRQKGKNLLVISSKRFYELV